MLTDQELRNAHLAILHTLWHMAVCKAKKTGKWALVLSIEDELVRRGEKYRMWA